MNLQEQYKNILAEAKDELDLCDLQWKDEYTDVHNYTPPFDFGQEDHSHFFAVCMGKLHILEDLMNSREELQSPRRYYLVNVDDTNINFINSSKEEFISESERQGLVYTSKGFQDSFNDEEIHSAVHQLRIYTV